MVPFRAFAAAACMALGTAVHAARPAAGMDDIERALHLNPPQRAQFETALAASHRALLSVALGGMQVKSRLFEELAKPKPDPEAIARAQDEAYALSGPAFNEAREEWQRFYAMLDADQVADARALVEEKLRRLERIGRELRGLLRDEDRR
jgi:hypothetical protein